MKLVEYYYNLFNIPYLKFRVYAQGKLVTTIVEKDRGQVNVTNGKKKFIVSNDAECYKYEKMAKVSLYDSSSCMPYSLNYDTDEEIKPLKLRLETISPEELQAAMERQTVIDLMEIGVTDNSWVKWVAYAVIVIGIGYLIFNLIG